MIVAGTSGTKSRTKKPSARSPKFFASLAAAMIFLSLLSGCAKGTLFDPVGETEVYTFFDSELIDLTSSKDLKEWAATFRRKSQLFVVINGRQSETYRAVGEVAFSPDGEKIIYPAYKGDEVYLVVNDGKTKKEYESISSVSFSPDSKKMVLRVKKNEKVVIIVNDREGKEYYGAREPIFSSNGEVMAFAAGKALDNRSPLHWTLVVNGKEDKQSYQDIFDVALGPDGKRIAFIAREGNKYFVIDGGAKGKEYEKVEWLILSPDGKKIGYAPTEGDKMFLTIDGIETKRYDEIYFPIFSSRGKDIAFFAREKEDALFIVNSKEMKTDYEYIENMTFSPDDKKIAFSARKDNSWVVATYSNGILRESRTYDLVSSPYFSPDSDRVGYYGQDGFRIIKVIEEIEM